MSMEEIFKTKRSKCRYHLADCFGCKGNDPERDVDGIVHYCIKDGMDNMRGGITEEDCENCSHYKSRFIEYPITVSKINIEQYDPNKALYKNNIGKMVKIRPCAEEYKDKTYLGIFLGELPQSPHISHNSNTNELNISPMYNPAIFVPDLKKIIFGCESWWSVVEKKEDLEKEITDELIEKQWYMQMAREMFGTQEKKKGENHE